MSPALVQALALLFVEAVDAGMDIAEFMREAKATGKLSPETWRKVKQEIEFADDLLDQALEDAEGDNPQG